MRRNNLFAAELIYAMKAWRRSGFYSTVVRICIAALPALGCSAASHAVCGVIPNTYPLYAGNLAAGGFTTGSGGKINNIGITVPKGGATGFTSTAVSTTSTQTLPDLSPAAFVSSTAAAGTTNSATVAAGDYDKVFPPGSGTNTVTTVFTGGTYHINVLGSTTTDVKNWTIQMAPGDYFIDKLDLHDANNIVISPAGIVRIYIKTSLSVHNDFDMNSGGTLGNFQLYMYPGALATFNDKTTLNGLIYAPGSTSDISFHNSDNSHTFTGAIITGGTMDFSGGNEIINYNAATQAAIGAINTCGPIANFLINVGASSASTCSAKNITITARDASNNVLTGFTGTINITTSSAHGDWAIVTGSGTIVNAPADDGSASYTFVGGDNGVVTLSLTNTHADDLTINVVATTVAASSSTSSTLNFRDNVFVVTSLDTLGTTAVAGRPHSMKAELWKKDPSTGNCAIDTKYTGNHSIDASYTADTDNPAGASAPSIYNGAPPSPGTACSATPSWTPLTTSFVTKTSATFASGVWNFCLATSDVGKFVINLRDSTRSYATGVDISGSSNTLTVRPFGIAITAVKQGATINPAGTATAGSKFVPAGNTSQAAAQFQATVAGYLWAFADDANNDGTPDSGANISDNTVAPHFDWATTLAAASTSPYFTPSTGSLGLLTGTTSIAKGAYASGQVTVSNLSYSEVGSFSMTAAITNFLNTAGVSLTGVNVNASGAATQIGRFYPDHFTLMTTLPSNITAACSAGGFTYMDQTSLGVSFSIEARSTADALTTNYGANYTTGTVSMLAENSDNGTDLSARLTVAAASWSGGQYSVNTGAAKFARAASPDGPFDSLQLGVTVTDADGAVLAARDMNPATAGACGGSCTGRALTAATRLRFGRLKMFNAYGSELLPLPVRMQVEYWNGTGFVVNTLDSCTTLATANIGLGSYQKNLTSITPNPLSGAFSSGVKTLTLPAPGATHNGSVDLVANLETSTTVSTCNTWSPSAPTPTASSLTHLRGQWCGAGYTRDPTARAAFGVYKGVNNIIYQRENY